jgi:hypothetical protein
MIEATDEYGLTPETRVMPEFFPDHNPPLLIGLGRLNHAGQFLEALAL